MFVSVRFSSIYGAFHCKQTSNAGGFCVHVSLSTSGVIQAAGRRCGAYSFVCFVSLCFMLLCYFDQTIYCLFLLPSSSSLTCLD